MERAVLILLWIVAGVWGLQLLVLLLNRLGVPRLDRRPPREPERWPAVSIVAPARDEEQGIREAVRSFCAQDYPDLEVIVVDDGSTDATPRILAELAAEEPRLKVIRIEGPPPGWLGKPHALETGRRAARGEWLLFVDADVVYGPELLRLAVAYVREMRAAMLVLPPTLVTRGFLEPVILSSIYYVACSTLPAFLATRTRWRWLAAGGGAFNLVSREALEASGAFASLKAAVVDDIGLGQQVKGAGFKQALALAGPLVRVRMYRGGAAVIRGFTKNLYPAVRPARFLLPLILGVGAASAVLPPVAWGLALAGLAPAAWLLPAALSTVTAWVLFAAIAVVFRQAWFIIFTNPLRELLVWWILLRSFLSYRRRGISWRGRDYQFPPAEPRP